MSNLNTNANPQNHMNMNIKMADTKPIRCDKCESSIFTAALHFRRVSALVSPTAQEAVVPLNIYVCHDCGHINDEFLPKELSRDDLLSKKK